MIKIVFFDIDGTLMYNQLISDSTKQAVRLLKDQGILPVIATGRCEYEVAPIREELGIEWAVTCNGSHVGFNGKTIVGHAFSRSMVNKWLETAAASEDHTLLLYGAEKMFINRPLDDPYFLRARREIGFTDPLSFSTPDELPEIYQCILYCQEEEAAAYTAGIEDEIYQHRWRTWAVDFNPKGMNKSVGIRTLLDHFGYAPDQAAAFGDGRNDIEMITFVGCGIAMGNACEELLTAADHVTLHAEEDGILHGVENLILQAQK